MQPTARTVLVILVVAVLEVCWTLFCAVYLPQTDTYLVVFYIGLLAASAVFFIPGLPEKGGRAR